MTPSEATTFNGHSESSVQTILSQLECGCIPYQDVFTYQRWLAQGYQVRHGQHGIRLPLSYRIEEYDEETEEIVAKTRRGVSVVFCRCQVDKIRRDNETKGSMPEVDE